MLNENWVEQSQSAPLERQIHSYQTTNYQRLRNLDPYWDSEQCLRTKKITHQARVKNENIKAAIKLIYKYKVSSISALYDTCTSEEWAELIYKANGDVTPFIKVGLDLFIKDNLDMQRQNRSSWLFSKADNGDVNAVIELNNLFRENNIDPIEFCKAVNDVLLCVHEKKNTLLLVGPPSTGKTLIARMICDNFICAYVNNHNSENEFYLSCFLNKTLVLCEELLVTPATCEDFKSILGGAPLLISKKYNDKQILTRTPVIITSNHLKFGRGHLKQLDEDALQTRCYLFNFTIPASPARHFTTADFCLFFLTNLDVN